MSCHVIPHPQCCTLSCLILSYTLSRTPPPPLLLHSIAPPLLHSVTSPPPLHHITSFPPLLRTILPVSASPFSPNAYTQLIIHPPATNLTRHPCIPHNSPSLSIRLILPPPPPSTTPYPHSIYLSPPFLSPSHFSPPYPPLFSPMYSPSSSPSFRQLYSLQNLSHNSSLRYLTTVSISSHIKS